MSAPSRRPEIRRRRARKEKILKLRKSLAAASSETDRARFRAKLHRQGLVSPGTPLLKSATELVSARMCPPHIAFA